MIVEGVPETITRAQYTELIASLGLNAAILKSLEFRVDGVYAEICTGKVDMAPDQPDREATHQLYIPVQD